MNTNMSEKILKLSNQIVFFSAYRNALAIMKKSVACTKNRNIPSCAVVTGPAGSGKSTLAKFFSDSFPRHRPLFAMTVCTPSHQLFCVRFRPK
ncbi:hypothetical protein KMZ27_08115 [Pseudomonas shirazica]|nr:hypothetical protein [Pseudomonas shirazica]